MSELTDSDEDIAFVESGFRVTPLIEIAGPIQDSAEFLANSWWRRTLINFAGGGKIVVTKPLKEEGGEQNRHDCC